MAKFNFKFDSLLRLKEQLEKNAKNELGLAVQALDREENLLSQMNMQMDEYHNIYRREAQGRINGEMIKNLKIYMDLFRTRIEEQINRVNKERINVDKNREKLTQIMKEKKVLEKLKERAYQRFIAEERKEEQLLVDEIVSYKYQGI